jgi:hypothetical protein
MSRTSDRYSPVHQLVNRAQDLACPSANKFSPRASKGLPDKFVVAQGQHVYDVVNKTIRTSTDYSPTPEAALSLPESTPAFLSQAPIPHPRFNGHKPVSFFEGEGWLKESVVDRKHKASVLHSLVHETAYMPLMPEAATSPKAPSHSPCLSRRPLDTAGPKQRLESMNTINAGMELVQRTEQMTEGSFLLEPPPAVPGSRLLDDRDFELDRWLHWKPPDLEESRRSADVVRLRDNGMSRPYSPGFETVITPFNPSLDLYFLLLGFELDRRLCWKPFDVKMSRQHPTNRRFSRKPPGSKEMRRHTVDVVRLKNSWMSRCYSPGPKMASMLLTPSLDSQPPLSGLKPDRRPRWRLLVVGIRDRCSIDVIRLVNNGMSSIYSPGLKTAITPFTFFSRYPHSPYRLWNTGPKRCHGQVNTTSGETELVLRAEPRASQMIVIERCPKLGAFSTRNGTMEGLYLIPKPPPVRHFPLRDLKLDRGLCWKPPKLKELGRHSIDVVRLRDNGMSRLCLPGFETALTPLTSEPVVV